MYNFQTSLIILQILIFKIIISNYKDTESVFSGQNGKYIVKDYIVLALKHSTLTCIMGLSATACKVTMVGTRSVAWLGWSVNGHTTK
jgi:hypothetical protein